MPDEEPENLQQYLPKHVQTATFNKPEERIPEGEFCPRCGYDLRGIKRGHPCPECGRPTQRTGARGRGGAVIGEYDIDYLKRVRLGLWFIMAWWLMIVVGPVISLVTSIDIIVMYGLLEVGIGVGMTGAYLIAAVPALTAAATGRRSRWLTVALVIGGLSLGMMIASHRYTMSATKFWMMRPAISPWLFVSFFLILAYQILLCIKCKTLAEKMGDESLERKFWNLAWILPISIVFTYFMAMLLPGNMFGFIFLCFTIVPFAAVGSEIAFVLFVNSLQNDFAWAVRYQYDDAERQERLRRKYRTADTAENNDRGRNSE